MDAGTGSHCCRKLCFHPLTVGRFPSNVASFFTSESMNPRSLTTPNHSHPSFVAIEICCQVDSNQCLAAFQGHFCNLPRRVRRRENETVGLTGDLEAGWCFPVRPKHRLALTRRQSRPNHRHALYGHNFGALCLCVAVCSRTVRVGLGPLQPPV